MDMGHSSNFKLENLFHFTDLFLLLKSLTKFAKPDYSRQFIFFLLVHPFQVIFFKDPYWGYILKFYAVVDF